LQTSREIGGSKLEKPVRYVLKKFAGACSGLIYKKGKTTPKEAKINLKVKAGLKHRMSGKLPQTT